MQITFHLKKAAFYIFINMLLLTAPLAGHSQIRMLHSDPEFDEYRIKKHLLIRGFSTDSAEALVNTYKYIFYKNLEMMQSQQSLSVTEDDGTASKKACECFEPTCWNLSTNTQYLTEHTDIPACSLITDLGLFFDHSISDWYTKNSNEYSLLSSKWLYAGSNWNPLSTSLGFNHTARYELNTNDQEVDPFTLQKIVPKGSLKSVRVGSPDFGINGEKIATRFTVGNNDESFNLNYSVVLFDPPSGHNEPSTRPSFSIRVFVNPPAGDNTFYEDCCQKYEIFSSPEIPGFKRSPIDLSIVYKPWSLRTIDLKRYAPGSELIVEVTTHHCAYGPHFSYAYIDGAINTPNQLIKRGPLCANSPITFSAGIFGTYKNENIQWTLTKDNGSTIVDTKSQTVTYPANLSIEDILKSGDPELEVIKNAMLFTATLEHEPATLPKDYALSLVVTNVGENAPTCDAIVLKQNFRIKDCEPIRVECEDCLPSFSPVPGKKYVISGWVKQKSSSLLTTYTGPEIWVRFNGVNTIAGPFKGSGAIIDGWQKIEDTLTVPEETSSLELELKNASASDVFFDDIRVYPFNGALRSFVYNAGDFKLRAELDENNYATFYDYDEQGELVRVRKETLKGVQTVKEIFTNTHKD